MKRIVISVGGNALSLDPQKDSKLLEPIAKLIVKLYDEGYQILLTTGNGPQSGEIFNSFVDANKFDQKHISYKLDEANAMSQGYIGYHVLKALENESLKSKIKIDTACLNTLTIVDEHDKAWKNPTKPIGVFCKTLDEAKKIYGKDAKIIEDAGRGYRKVVPSPKPINFTNLNSIEKCFKSNILTIASIGGGIPCIIKNNTFIGVEGIIDKDYSTAKLAELLKADLLLVATGVTNIFLNYNKPNQKTITKTTYKEMNKYLGEYDFGAGSMEPKLKSALEFVKNTGKTAIITDIKNAYKSLKFKAGTIITK